MFSRRNMLKSMSAGFGSIALTGLLAEQSKADHKRPLVPKEPHFGPKAKHVIFMCMRGAPEQTDTFDYKPRDSKSHFVEHHSQEQLQIQEKGTGRFGCPVQSARRKRIVDC